MSVEAVAHSEGLGHPRRCAAKQVVLHFWFNTCAGCLVEQPAFEFAAAHAGSPDVAVVSLHFGGTAREVAAWARERGIGFRGGDGRRVRGARVGVVEGFF